VLIFCNSGRLLDLHKQGFIDLDHLHALVLDEADQMLDMGFVNDVKKIVKLTPKNRQTLFLCNNANCDSELAEMFLKSNSDRISVSSTAENVEQHVYFVEKNRNLLYQSRIKTCLMF
jgi:ATP-dependent RNA helicase RhlE